MNFEFSQEQEAFRQEVRAFLKDKLPADMARRTWHGFHPPTKADRHGWQRLLYDRGWAAPNWPKAFGGTGWNALERHIFADECWNAHAPLFVSAGLDLLGPVVYTFGSKAQQERYLDPILRGEELWAQGFSEPSAGSDLVSLRTRAERRGDHYVVNGQKIWTSEGHYATQGFFLVRSDPKVKPQQGISFLIIDMRSKGVTVRPIIGMDGLHYVNEVFLEDVIVPAENLVGEEGKGWSYAKFLLENERTASAEIYWTKAELKKARQMAQAETVDGVPLIDTPAYSRKLARVEADLQALEYAVLRVLCEEKSTWHPTAVASYLKVRGSELQQRATELQNDALALRALRYYHRDDPAIDDLAQRSAWPDYVPGSTSLFLLGRAFTIYGGAKEVQKNIISKLAFSL